LSPGWLPASEWWINPSSRPWVVWPAVSRVHRAISRASSGSSVGIDPAVRQPTIRLEYTSETNAVNTVPDQVGT
jgi:hypothetical protein